MKPTHQLAAAILPSLYKEAGGILARAAPGFRNANSLASAERASESQESGVDYGIRRAMTAAANGAASHHPEFLRQSGAALSKGLGRVSGVAGAVGMGVEAAQAYSNPQQALIDANSEWDKQNWLGKALYPVSSPTHAGMLAGDRLVKQFQDSNGAWKGSQPAMPEFRPPTPQQLAWRQQNAQPAPSALAGPGGSINGQPITAEDRSRWALNEENKRLATMTRQIRNSQQVAQAQRAQPTANIAATQIPQAPPRI